MTREEQIEKAAVENGCGFYDNGYARFAEGAAWADEHPDISMVSALAYEAGRNDAIAEAREWLEKNVDDYLVIPDNNYEGWSADDAYIHDNLYRDFFESMKGGEEQHHPHWISVDEELPAHAGRCVYIDGLGTTVDCLLYAEPIDRKGPFEGRYRFGFYNFKEKRWEIRGQKWNNTRVTHWMPLPTPPEKGGEQ